MQIIYAYMQVRLHVCKPVCSMQCLCMRAATCSSACMQTKIHACSVCASMQYMHANQAACMCACMQKWLHACSMYAACIHILEHLCNKSIDLLTTIQIKCMHNICI